MSTVNQAPHHDLPATTGWGDSPFRNLNEAQLATPAPAAVAEAVDRLVLISALVFLPGLVLVLVANRRLSAGLSVLTRVAQLPPGPVETCGIREIDSAASVLSAALTAEAEAAGRLRAINTDLEKAVTEALAEREAAVLRSLHARPGCRGWGPPGAAPAGGPQPDPGGAMTALTRHKNFCLLQRLFFRRKN